MLKIGKNKLNSTKLSTFLNFTRTTPNIAVSLIVLKVSQTLGLQLPVIDLSSELTVTVLHSSIQRHNNRVRQVRQPDKQPSWQKLKLKKYKMIHVHLYLLGKCLWYSNRFKKKKFSVFIIPMCCLCFRISMCQILFDVVISVSDARWGVITFIIIIALHEWWIFHLFSFLMQQPRPALQHWRPGPPEMHNLHHT